MNTQVKPDTRIQEIDIDVDETAGKAIMRVVLTDGLRFNVALSRGTLTKLIDGLQKAAAKIGH